MLSPVKGARAAIPGISWESRPNSRAATARARCCQRSLAASVPRRRRPREILMSCTFVPPYLLDHLASAAGGSAAATSGRSTLLVDRRLRGRRDQPAPAPLAPPSLRAEAEAAPRRVVHTAGGSESLPGTPVRSDEDPATGDAAVDEAFDLLRAGVGPLRRGLRPRLGRRARQHADGHRPLRPGLRQRLLGRQPAGLRRRRRRDLRPLHQADGRDGARVHPRGHPVHRGPHLPGPVRSAQRERQRRLRLADQAARAGPGRRPTPTG